MNIVCWANRRLRRRFAAGGPGTISDAEVSQPPCTPLSLLGSPKFTAPAPRLPTLARRSLLSRSPLPFLAVFWAERGVPFVDQLAEGWLAGFGGMAGGAGDDGVGGG